MERADSRKIFEGFQTGIGLLAAFAIGGVAISYGSAAWGNLPQTASGSGLTATMWNDLVTQVNGLASALQVSSGNVGIGTSGTPTAKLEVNGGVKASGFQATSGAPRMVGIVDVEGSATPLTRSSAPSGWLAVPGNTLSENLAVPVTVSSTQDAFVVTASYRRQTDSVSAFNSWSGIRVSGPTPRFFQTDGTVNTATDFGVSGAVTVTGLSPGNYSFQLEDWMGVSANRSYYYNREIAVYQIR